MYFSPFFVRVLNKLKLLSIFNGYSNIVVNGKKVRIPLLGGVGVANLHLSEPWMTKVLFQLKPLFGGCFIDVGVNVGQTLIKVHSIFRKVKYVGFEPNSTCVHYLQELVRINKLIDYTVLPIAVGVRTEILKLNFFAADSSDSAASIIERFRPNSKEDHFDFVPIFDLHEIDDFLPDSTNSVVKIDVEGAELNVLLGLDKWIKMHQPIILVEILPVYSSENVDRLERQKRIEELLMLLNYNMSRIKKSEGVHLQPLNSIGIHCSIDDCDYVLYPASLKDKVLGCFR